MMSFAIDCPFRGYFVWWMYELIGLNPWLYSLGAFLMRRVNSLGLLWILRTIWPEERPVARAEGSGSIRRGGYPGLHGGSLLGMPGVIENGARVELAPLH
jgi:hypothetical protein